MSASDAQFIADLIADLERDSEDLSVDERDGCAAEIEELRAMVEERRGAP